MCQNLSVRAYEAVEQTHSHHFHQVVIPLHGALELSLEGIPSALSAGQGVVIKKHVEHSFSARKDANFLVADLYDLPNSAKCTTNSTTTLSNAFRSFCSFAQVQLQRDSSIDLDRSMITIFEHLLATQNFHPNIDRRICRALAHIASDPSKDYKLAELASVSALSVSQFKLLFTHQMGMTVGKYLLKLRMERARTLLKETSMSVNCIAESSGYKDQSAFTRRFRQYYGESPSQYRLQ